MIYRRSFGHCKTVADYKEFGKEFAEETKDAPFVIVHPVVYVILNIIGEDLSKVRVSPAFGTGEEEEMEEILMNQRWYE